MLPTTVQAMANAAGSFVDLDELQRKVGDRLAVATRNEAAYVSTGAAAGIVLVVTACLVGADARLRSLLPDASTLARNEVIIQRGQRNGYDAAVRQTGARIVEVDPTPDALAAALSERLPLCSTSPATSPAVPLRSCRSLPQPIGDRFR